jgi:hypothetical protein
MPDTSEYLIVIEFGDLAAFQRYLRHPAHEELDAPLQSVAQFSVDLRLPGGWFGGPERSCVMREAGNENARVTIRGHSGTFSIAVNDWARRLAFRAGHTATAASVANRNAFAGICRLNSTVS